MKAKICDRIQTVIEIRGDFNPKILPKGTLGTIVECYEQPEGYAVDLAIPDETLIGGFQYQNVVLTPQQFTIVESPTTSLVGTTSAALFDTQINRTIKG